MFLFDAIIKLEDSDIDHISADEKLQKTVLIYDILCNTLIGPKPFRTRVNKIDGFIRIYDVTTILAEICGTNYRNTVKLDKTSKMQYLILRAF